MRHDLCKEWRGRGRLWIGPRETNLSRSVKPAPATVGRWQQPAKAGRGARRASSGGGIYLTPSDDGDLTSYHIMRSLQKNLSDPQEGWDFFKVISEETKLPTNLLDPFQRKGKPDLTLLTKL
uniref:Uncharacterized protein n=1 Tax=Oryza meridionalis TaxID=40149 RepID=A0A0E0D4B6_9ORYZ